MSAMAAALFVYGIDLKGTGNRNGLAVVHPDSPPLNFQRRGSEPLNEVYNDHVYFFKL